MSHGNIALRGRDTVGRSECDEECLNAFQEELDYVYRTLCRLGVSRSDVEDLAQDVFLALRGSWAEYDRERPIRPYLFGIAFRIASAHQRKRKREIAFGTVEADDKGPWPDALLQSKQARKIVLAAFARIPLSRRAALVMHELDQVPVAEVAAVLATPLFTVYSRLRKARRELEVAVRRTVRRVDVDIE
jgi:RNA polymerase sigma-70 factor (ECF subfamily)